MLDSHYSFQNIKCMTVWLYHICSFLQMNSSPSRMDSLTPFRGLQSRHESPQSPQRNWEAATDRNNKRRNDRFKGNLEDCLGLRVRFISLFWLCLIHRDWIWYKARVKSFDMVAKLLRTQWWVRRGDDQFGASLSLPFLTRPVHTLVYDDGEDAKLLPGSYPKYEFVDVLLIVLLI